MANWTVSQGTTSATADTAIGSLLNVVDLTISNVQGGEYILNAANFKIGGATETSTNTWTGGNVDSQVDYVVFSNNFDSAGNSLNTVNAKVYLKSFITFSANTTVYVDIDESTTNPPIESGERSVCFTTQWLFNFEGVGTAGTSSGDAGSGYTYTINNPDSAIAAGTLIDNGTTTTTPGSGIVKVKHQGTVDANSQVCIADITFTRSGNNYFEGYGDFEGSIGGAFLNLNNIGTYSGFYTDLITPTIGFIEGSSGPQAYTSFNYKIFYTPPQEFDPILEDDFCDLNHGVDIKFEMRTPAESTGINVSNQINTVAFESEVNMNGGTNVIEVNGSANTSYNLSVIGSGAKELFGATSFYNFVTGKFDTSPSKPQVFKTNSLGKSLHYVKFPTSTADNRYDIVVGAQTGTTLASGIPTRFGQAKITQFGMRNLILSPDRADATKYGTLPSQVNIASRPFRYSSSKMSRTKTISVQAICAKALTAGTTLVLKRPNSDIKPGMSVVVPFAGNGVPHLTTVVKVKENRVTLSANATIAQNQRVRFDLNNTALVPFSFAVQTGGNTLSFGSTQIGTSKDAIYGLTSVVRQVADAGVSASTTVNMETSKLEGIEVGMTVSGPTVPTGTTVTAINRSGNSFTASQAFTVPALADGIKQFLNFSPTSTNDVGLVHAQADIETFTDATCDYNNDPTIAHDVNAAIVTGLSVSGTGIPSGATVTLTSDTAFELSASTTGGAVTNGTLTFTIARVTGYLLVKEIVKSSVVSLIIDNLVGTD